MERERDHYRAALVRAQADICNACCIHGPPRPHCPACVDARNALNGCEPRAVTFEEAITGSVLASVVSCPQQDAEQLARYEASLKKMKHD
jgi:hypothetical protein